jgi:predicted O-methyltransferase YrrM
MNYKKTNAYIESLYKSKLSQSQYLKATEIDDFGAVIDDDVARMLQVLIMLAKPKMVLEIGTSIGFSTVMMAKIMKQYGGKIITIELDKKVAKQAMVNFKREGVNEQIDIIVGDVREVVANMKERFDLIFQDVGDKSLYAEMIDNYLQLLNTGGLLLAEDVLFPIFDFSGKDSYLNPMKKSLDLFNKTIAKHPHFESTLLPIGDGLMIALKTKRDI